MPRAEPLIETPSKTLGEARTKINCYQLRDVKIEAIIVTLGEVKARHALGDTVGRVEIRTVDGTLGHWRPQH